MRRIRQTLPELLGALSQLSSDWRDSHAQLVIRRLGSVPKKSEYSRVELERILSLDGEPESVSNREYFEAGVTAVRLFLGLSKDEFNAKLQERLGKSMSLSVFERESRQCLDVLEALGVVRQMNMVVNTPVPGWIYWWND